MVLMMNIVTVKTKEQKKKFLKFRKKIYNENANFVDNNISMIQQLFSSKTCFLRNKEVIPLYVEENDNVICECIAVYAKDLPQYIQLCFFESKKNAFEAVKLLIDKVIEIGRCYVCTKLVVGLNGHVNYGLGLLDSHFTEKNSYSSSGNPSYYNDYFRKLNYEEVRLNTYTINGMEEKAFQFVDLINSVNEVYTFKYLDTKNLDYYVKIYTDLNNASFVNHRYYYKRSYKEDMEMLKELLLFMKPDSLIFAFKNDKPVGFILWYPDFNELVKENEEFGIKTFIKNIFFNSRIKKGKIMEIGILEECRKTGLAIGLINEVFLKLKKYGIKNAESSWVLEENHASNKVCKSISDGLYKKYVAYEKEI